MVLARALAPGHDADEGARPPVAELLAHDRVRGEIDVRPVDRQTEAEPPQITREAPRVLRAPRRSERKRNTVHRALAVDVDHGAAARMTDTGRLASTRARAHGCPITHAIHALSIATNASVNRAPPITASARSSRRRGSAPYSAETAIAGTAKTGVTAGRANPMAPMPASITTTARKNTTPTSVGAHGSSARAAASTTIGTVSATRYG